MEIEGHVVAFPSEAAGQGDVVDDARQAARPGDFDDRVEMGTVAHDRRRPGFHEIVDPRLGEVTPERPDRGRREHDVADQAQPDEQDLQGSTVASSMSMTGMSSLIG